MYLEVIKHNNKRLDDEIHSELRTLTFLFAMPHCQLVNAPLLAMPPIRVKSLQKSSNVFRNFFLQQLSLRHQSSLCVSLWLLLPGFLFIFLAFSSFLLSNTVALIIYQIFSTDLVFHLMLLNQRKIHFNFSMQFNFSHLRVPSIWTLSKCLRITTSSRYISLFCLSLRKHLIFWYFCYQICNQLDL